MRQFLPLIIIFIIWRVTSASRQAKREKELRAQKAATNATTETPAIDRVYEAIRTPELASHERTIDSMQVYDLESQETREVAQAQPSTSSVADAWLTVSSQPNDYLNQADATRAEEERDRPSYEKSRARKKSGTVTRGNSTTEASAAASDLLAATAYDTEKVGVRRRISLDDASLKTFFITREVLGPPRARERRNPFKR